MKNFHNYGKLLLFSCLFSLLSVNPKFAHSQQLQISDFSVFGGIGNCPGGPGCTNPLSPGCAAQIGNGSKIMSGDVGSYTLVKSTGTVQFSGALRSGGKIQLGSYNSVAGKISAANTANATGTIFSCANNALLSSDIDVKGKIVVAGGTVIGKVTHPSGTSYTGPVPAGTEVIGTPNLPILPVAPPVTVFPAAGATTISSTQTILPGSYNKILLNGSKTITFSGPGVYVFNSITNSGSFNKFVFDFKNNATGEFYIYVHGNVNLSKLHVDIINGGSASRIYAETHGTGSPTSPYAWLLSNGVLSGRYSEWKGTVWAPYAAIKIGGSTGNSNVTGAIWSRTQVDIKCGVTVNHAPFLLCSPPVASAGTDKVLTCTNPAALLIATSSVPGSQFNWVASNGGSIITGQNNDTLEVNTDGTYTVTVTANGCSASDVAVVTSNKTIPTVNAGNDTALTCSNLFVQLTGSTNAANPQYLWQPINGGVINSPANAATINASAGGKYVLTVTNGNNGCSANDTAKVVFIPCIFPYYPPPVDGKVDDLIGSELNSLYYNFGQVQDSAKNIFLLFNDSVYIEIIALLGRYNTLKTLLQTPPYGMTDLIDNGPSTLIVTGKYPISNLLKLDSLPNLIDYARPLYPALSNVGAVTSAGDISQFSNLARAGYNVSGDGVKVGVLSDSYNTVLGNNAATDIANGDLPSTIQVIKEFPLGRRTDEGRAMLQIVSDVAPGADLAFRTGFISAGDFSQGIRELQQAGCDVIVDDITYITEPFFEDGTVAQAVDEVAALGVSYFSAAGNYGNKSFQSVFNPTAAPGTISGSAHDFGGGDVFQSVSLSPGNYTIVMQWQDSIYSLGQTATGTSNDLDIYLTDNNGVTLFGFNRDNRGADPLEVLPFTVTGNTTTNILIVRAHGTTNVNFKYVVFRGELTINEYNSGTSTIVGQANAAGAIAVGAVLYTNTPPFGVNPPTIASFSSTGGTPVNGVTRQKPEIIAPNGINTTVGLGGPNIDGDLFPNFFGTSAAAPHAAGAAALLIEAKDKFYNAVMLPSELRTILLSTALNMDTPGFDFRTGFGLLRADTALSLLAAPVPIINSLQPADTSITPGDTTFTLRLFGEFLTASSVIYFRGLPLPTVVISSTELNATIPAFTGNPPVQVYNPPFSTTNSDGGFSDSAFFFSPIKKNIIVTADNKTKLYGEAMPPFTVSILVDSVPLTLSGYTLTELGLDNILFTSPANSLSNTGIYIIVPSIDPLDPTDSIDVALLENFTYEFNQGLISINKLPLTITPNDTTLVYGESIGGITFTYDYDQSNVAPGDQAALLNSIESEHQANLASEIALIDANTIVNGRTLMPSDIQNLGFLVSGRALVNARALVNSPIVNNIQIFDTTYIVDVAVQSIFNFQLDPSSSPLVSAGPLVNGRALVNGPSLVNGSAIVNGRALVNGPSIVNSTNVTNDNEELIIIIDEDDVNAPPNDTLTLFKSINVVTGITSGEHDIIPGALVSNNFDITYALGKLTITPATLTITANDKVTSYGTSPVLTSTISGYQFSDSAGNVLETLPQYVVLNSLNDTVDPANSPAGIYTIVPFGAALFDSSNYVLVYENGTLEITAVSLIVRADNQIAYVGDPLPTFTVTYTGFRNGDQATIISGPVFTIGGNPAVAGVYGLTPSALVLANPANYTITYQPGILYVNPKGPGTQKILVYLNCIDSLGPNPTGFNYLAHFGYTNANASPVFVPKGIDNNISSFGGFSQSQPELFLPGTGSADIYFNGALLTWSVKSYENITKQTSSAAASSGSVRCLSGTRNSLLTENSDPSLFNLYPNPVTDFLHININAEETEGLQITVTDMLGKASLPQLSGSGTNIDLDMNNLMPGVYLVRLVLNNTWQVFQIIKQ
jgi:Subtilase family/MBG domain (YGX type)/Secretion system C-terminal sorting domain